MAQSDARGPNRGSATAKASADDLMAIGSQRVEALMDMQKELLATFDQIRRERLARAQQESELMTTFAGKLTSARSMPEVMIAYQEWAAKRMELFTQDSRTLAEDSQKIFNAAARMLSNGTRGDTS